MFKTLGKIKWDDIKIGEVFAWQSIVSDSLFIDIKLKEIGSNCTMTLSVDSGMFFYHGYYWCCMFDVEILYKLPENVQNLFITK